MSMDQETILGNFNKIPDILPAEGVVKVSFQPIDLMSHWKKCGLTADFGAAFYTFSRNVRAEDEEKIKSILSTVLNELIENAAKFSRQKSVVELVLKNYSNTILIEAANEVHGESAASFMKLCRTLLESDLEELYFKQLEEKSVSNSSSGIGLMMLMKDYDVELAFRFVPVRDSDTPDVTRLTVRAFVNIQ